MYILLTSACSVLCCFCVLYTLLFTLSAQGQLGLGTYNSDPIYTITQIPFYSSLSITRVTVGENTHFATTGTSHIHTKKAFLFILGTTYYSCGSNSDGQLGQGTTASSTPNPTVMSDLSGGNYTIYALPKATVAYSRMIQRQSIALNLH